MSYSEHWNRFRRWNRYGIASLIFSCIVLFWVLPQLEAKVPWALFPLIRHIALIGCWLVFFYFVVRQQDFECPRCGKHFFWRGSMEYAVAFRRKCVHCGLGLYANGPNTSLGHPRER
jgi:hypothetical protein